jgi:hypothetical protein
VEVRRSPVDAAKAVGRDIAAYHQEVTAKLLHNVELALGAGEHLGTLRLWHAFKIAEGLEDGTNEAKVLDHTAHVRRRSIEGQQIVLEDLDPLELGGRDSLELFVQCTAETNGGDGGLHGFATFILRVAGDCDGCAGGVRPPARILVEQETQRVARAFSISAKSSLEAASFASFANFSVTGFTLSRSLATSAGDNSVSCMP